VLEPTLVAPILAQIIKILTETCRWIYSYPFSFQFSLWLATLPWSTSLRQDGKLYGRARDCAQCLWSINTLNCGHVSLFHWPLTKLTRQEDMELFVKSVLAQEPWKYDSKVIAMPWRQEETDIIVSKVASGNLTLGYFTCDDNVLPHPPILRGIEMVVSMMKKKKHTLFEWKPYRHPFAVDLIDSIYTCDGGIDIFSTLERSGEPPIPNFKDLIHPSLVKIDMNELWDLQLKKWAYQMEYLEQIRLKEQELGREIDAIIMPITPTAAIRHNQFKYNGYASAINLLDFTSVVVPVTFADKAIDKKQEGYIPLGELDRVVQEECEFTNNL
jgi:amidase